MDVLDTHLPRILDLASNFDIDLSGVLSGYAQKLRDNAPELEGFSFPQAALLLQHCAEIYGRKVDYVYHLAIELCENMNVRLYSSGASSAEENQDNLLTSPKKSNCGRKRKTAVTIAIEDFQLLPALLDKPKVITKHPKRKKGLCTEGVCVRLAPKNFKNNHEYHIYEEDQLASIGTKDQYRLNWPIENSCRLEEYIRDAGCGSSWYVCDVGVSNMPTPEYSDEGATEARSDSLSITGIITNNEVPDNIVVTHTEEIPLSGCNGILSKDIQSSQTLGPKFNAMDGESTHADKPQSCPKNTFKLPYELTRKGLQGTKPEANITLFLFSKMLKRSLNMKGPLPPLLKGRDFDKKLVRKHVSFLMKRYNLEARKTMDIHSLLENQADFLGFEEEKLGDSPEVLTSLEPFPEPSVPQTEAPVNDMEDTGNEDDGVQVTVPACTSKRKSAVGEAEVADWRQFIQSKLNDDENKNGFDIHAYESNIVNAFHHVGEKVPFGELVGGLDRREISRYFLSVLMLANSSNVTLEDSGINTLKLTLNNANIQSHVENIPEPSSAASTREDCSHPKRKACSNIEDEPELCEKGYRKQIPGKGPWRNKSRKSKGS